MSYFYDVYVSSYVDEHQDSDHGQRWINNLIYFFDSILTSRLDRQATIVSTADFKEDGILHGRDKAEVLNSSALLVIVLNDSYLNDPACLQEIQLFLSFIAEGTAPARVLKVLKQPVAEKNLPSQLADCSRYDFYLNKSFQGDIEEELLYFHSMQDVFWLKLVDLAFDVDNMINALNTDNLSFFLGKTVYLADTTDDQKENLDSVRRELVRHGYKILPDKALSRDPWKLRAEVLGYLGASTLSVHLIGNKYGELLNKSEYSAVDLQNKIAADYYVKLEKVGVNKREQPFARLIWINPDSKQINPQQKKYIEELRNDDKLVKGADVLEIPIEILKSTIHIKTNHINKIKRELEEEEGLAEQRDPKKIYFIHEKEVSFNCSLLQKWLNNNDFTYEEPVWCNNQIEQIQHHQRKIIENNFVLIYYSGENIEWLKSKVYDLVKTAGFERKLPHLGKAIYSDVDLSELEGYLSKMDILKLDQAGGIEEKLQPFIDKINGEQ